MTSPNMPTPTAAPSVVGTVGGGSMPRVNLMPTEIAEAAKFRRFQFAMAGAGVAAVVLVGFLSVQASASVSSAKSQLAAAQQQHTVLQSQLASLSPVRDVYSQVAAKQAMLRQAMGGEIRWSYYLTDLSLRIPDNVWLTSITATETQASQSSAPKLIATPQSTSVLPTGIGTVQFAGVAFSHNDVANWLDSLAKEKGYTNVYFSNATRAVIATKPVVDFASSVTMTTAALSGRYLNALEG